MKTKKEIKRYKAIIFDLDGTLIDSLPYHFISIKKVLNKHGIYVKNSYLKKIIGLATKIIFREFKKKYKLKESIDDLINERREIYYNLISKKDITFPSVKKTLDKLKPNYKLAIATGSSRITVTHSTSPGFLKMFNEIVTINDTKRGKPFADPLFLTAKRLKFKTSECLMIGDSVYDALAAKRAKIDFIGVVTGFTKGVELKKIGAVRIVKSIKELEKIL